VFIVGCLEESFWMAREIHHQGFTFLGYLGFVWCGSRSISESLIVLN